MPRAGTTTLWNLLRAHPDIFMPAIKEPRHFDEDLPADPYARFRRFPLPQSALNVHRDRSRYLALFSDADGHHAVGEASLYIRSRIAARRIHEFNRDAKFILLLRDPVDALYSFYHLHLNNASIRCTFDEFFTEFAPWYQRVPDHLKLIQALFGTESVSIHLFEDLVRDAHQVYRSVLQFLEVDPDFSPDFKTHNSSSRIPPPGFPQWLMSLLHSPFATRLRMRVFAQEIGISKAITRLVSGPRPKLPTDQRRRYSEVLRPSLRELAAMTKRDLSGWL